MCIQVIAERSNWTNDTVVVVTTVTTVLPQRIMHEVGSTATGPRSCHLVMHYIAILMNDLTAKQNIY